MKKVIAIMSIVGVLTFLGTSTAVAQEQTSQGTATTEQVSTPENTSDVAKTADAKTGETQSFHQVLKQKYIDGGAAWMTPILLVLILGLALVIERILYLNIATTNTTKLLANIETFVKKGDYESAKKLCYETRGPVASIFYQGLDRIDEGLDNVEKAVVSYGGVQMGRLESNMSWVSLCIALAPMLGFLGTVIGMVQAFDDIEQAGDISPTVVAAGMKVALLTTVFGLIVALVLQVCYNYLISKIDSLVNTMEDNSITFMDILIKNKK